MLLVFGVFAMRAFICLFNLCVVFVVCLCLGDVPHVFLLVCFTGALSLSVVCCLVLFSMCSCFVCLFKLCFVVGC